MVVEVKEEAVTEKISKEIPMFTKMMMIIIQRVNHHYHPIPINMMKNKIETTEDKIPLHLKANVVHTVAEVAEAIILVVANLIKKIKP